MKMPPTTASEFGDVILVPFPFTDQSAAKKRPAVVISSREYNRARPDMIVAAVTGHVVVPPAFGELVLLRWRQAGLLKPSTVKPVVLTIAKSIVLKQLGRLLAEDRDGLRDVLKRGMAA